LQLLKLACNGQVFLDPVGRPLAHQASGNEMLITQQKNILVPDDQTTLFLSPEMAPLDAVTLE